MKPRSRRLILAGATALLAVAAWFYLGNPPSTSQRLTDGSTVSLLGVSYGRKHRLVSGPVWQRAIARLLPEKAARRLGFQIVSHTTTNDTLMAWTALRDLPGPANRITPTPVTISDGQRRFSNARRKSTRLPPTT
jgi:hypothetical protein